MASFSNNSSVFSNNKFNILGIDSPINNLQRQVFNVDVEEYNVEESIPPLTLSELNELTNSQKVMIDKQISELEKEYAGANSDLNNFIYEVNKVSDPNMESEGSWHYLPEWKTLVDENGSEAEALNYLNYHLQEELARYDELLAIDDGTVEEYEIKNAKNRILSYSKYLKELDIYDQYRDGVQDANAIMSIDNQIQVARDFVETYSSIQKKRDDSLSMINALSEQRGTLLYQFIQSTLEYNDYEVNSEIRNPLSDYSNVNPDLVKMYSFIYDKYGEEEAQKYMSCMSEEIKRCDGALEAQYFLKKLDEDPDNAGEYINNFMHTFGEGWQDGIYNFLEGFSGWGYALDGVEVAQEYSVEDYRKLYILMSLMSEQEKIDAGLIGKDESGNMINMDPTCPIDYTKNYGDYNEVYEFGTMVGNMTIPVGVNVALTPAIGPGAASWVSAGLIFGSSGGTAVKHARAAGASTYECIVYGLINGGSEALLEKYLGNIVSETKVTSLTTFIKSMPKEILEENMQNVINWGTNYLMLGETISLSEMWDETKKTSMYSFMLSGLMNLPAIVGSGIKGAYNKITDSTPDEIETMCAEIGIEINENEAIEIQKYADVFSKIPNEHISVVSEMVNSYLSDDGTMVYDFDILNAYYSDAEIQVFFTYVKEMQQHNPNFKIKMVEKTQYGELYSESSYRSLISKLDKLNSKAEVQEWLDTYGSAFDLSGLSDAQKEQIYNKLTDAGVIVKNIPKEEFVSNFNDYLSLDFSKINDKLNFLNSDDVNELNSLGKDDRFKIFDMISDKSLKDVPVSEMIKSLRAGVATKQDIVLQLFKESKIDSKYSGMSYEELMKIPAVKNLIETTMEENYKKLVINDKVDWNTNKDIIKDLKLYYPNFDTFDEKKKSQLIVDWKNNNQKKYEQFRNRRLKEATEIADTTISILKRYESEGYFKDGYSYSDVLALIQDDVDPIFYLSEKTVSNWKNSFLSENTAPNGYVNVFAFQSENNGVLSRGGSIGRDEGMFAMTEASKNEIMDPKRGYLDPETKKWIQICNENGEVINTAALSKALGGVEFPPGADIVLIKEIIKVDDLQMSRGSLDGAFLGDWVPGGKTMGGAAEGLVPHLTFDVSGAIVKGKSIINSDGDVTITNVSENKDASDFVSKIISSK